MVNSVEFTNRLKRLMEYFGESASSFSDKIAVQRSSISHIISGRNKPSLDFILKILNAYPDINLYWLLNGTGKMLKILEPDITNTPGQLFTQKLNDSIIKSIPSESENESENTIKSIEQIVIFFSDGTFKNYICNKND